MCAPLVDVEDLGWVPPQVAPKFRGRDEVPRAGERQLEKGEAFTGTERLEITSRPTPDPHVVSPGGEAFRGLQHLCRRPGGESVFVDHME
jgi:hypothetical protein